jgi:lysophospholipase L1-like esterase
MVFTRNQKIFFDGDSITDAGRDDSSFGSYGHGYVALVIEHLQAHHANLGLEFVNRGVGGDTTRQMLERFERDIVAHKPDWVSIAIGVNDVWRFFGDNRKDAVPLEEFERNYRSMLERLGFARLILVAPFLIEPDRDDPFRAKLDRYAVVVEALALEFNAIFVPFQAAFDASPLEPSAFSHDRVHPNAAGSELLAQTFLRAIGA